MTTGPDLAALRNRIDAGTVEASDDFMQTFDAVRTLVDAAGTPGARVTPPEPLFPRIEVDEVTA